ncbi:MAG: ABC transporter substrate-binding protein [Alphaproteobacteria bacterium]|nr:MAG: ABC transporter substrate-binding protein [Alphaproteobacteria bacterium]
MGVIAAGVASAADFKWSFSGDAQTLDPHGLAEIFTLGFQSNIYEPLVRRNSELALEPALAVSWEQKDDVTWVFKLRQDVKFQNGNPFTADDVLFSHQRASSPSSDVKAKLRSIQTMTKLDDHTVEIKTNGPSPTLLDELSDFFIMDKEWSEANNSAEPADVRKGAENFATRHANGTGPFAVESRQPDVETVFVPNKDWWDTPEHNITRAVFTPIGSDATRVAALLSGEVEMIFPVPLQDAARVEANPDTKMLRAPELRVIYFGFDTWRDELQYSSVKGKNPFKDKRVREAVFYAIDEDAIVEKIMEGAARPAGVIMGQGVNGYTDELGARAKFDLDKSKKLLADAGYPDGFEVTLDCPNDRYVNDEEICLAAAGMLARAGIKVNVNAMTKTKYFGKVLDRDTSMYLMGWTPPTYDAHNILFDALGTPQDNGQGKWNMGNYSNPAVDELQKKIAVTVDLDKRRQLIAEAFQIVKDDMAVVPLHQQPLSWGARSNISLVQRADDRFEMRWVKVN